MTIRGAFRLGEMGKAFVEPVLGERNLVVVLSPMRLQGGLLPPFPQANRRGAALEPLEEIVVPG